MVINLIISCGEHVNYMCFSHNEIYDLDPNVYGVVLKDMLIKTYESNPPF